jgi:hypothetical protein
MTPREILIASLVASSTEKGCTPDLLIISMVASPAACAGTRASQSRHTRTAASTEVGGRENRRGGTNTAISATTDRADRSRDALPRPSVPSVRVGVRDTGARSGDFGLLTSRREASRPAYSAGQVARGECMSHQDNREPTCRDIQSRQSRRCKSFSSATAIT